MPIFRADQLPEPPARARPFGPTAVADSRELAAVYQLWGATKLTVRVVGNPVFLQLSRTQPPEPPVWDEPVPIDVGPYGHGGPFGYWRFYNQVPGQGGNVAGAAWAE